MVSLAGYLWLRVFYKAAIKVAVGLQSSEGTSGRGSFSKFTHMAVSRIQFLTGWWTWDLVNTRRK